MDFLIRCSYQGCRESLHGVAVVPSLFADTAMVAGWEPGDRERPDVLSSGALWHCPQHRSNGGGWRDEPPTFRADCATCMEAFEGSEEECREWADDHEPDVSVHRVRPRGGQQ